MSGHRRLGALLCILVAAMTATCGRAAAPTLNQNPLQDVPMQFRGEWNGKLEDCGTALNDSVLVIKARWIKFYESGGPILAVITQGKTNLSLIARLTSGEAGSTWDEPRKFELSENQAVLKDTTQAGDPFTRYKCPKPAR